MKDLKLNYEKASVELIYFSTCDIMTLSGGFDAEDDDITGDWPTK